MDIDDAKLFKLTEIKDVPKNGSLIVTGPSGDEIALFNLGGKIYAISNVCPHEGGPLGEGDIDCGFVTCPWHGWQFDIATGDCVNVPEEKVKKYEITINDGSIFIKEND